MTVPCRNTRYKFYDMAPTRLTDLQIPSNWADYVIEMTAEKSALWQSGIVASDERFNAVAASGGSSVNMPMFKDLAGRSEILQEGVPLTVNKISTAVEKAVIHNRGKAWGASDLGAALSGTDPLGAIASLVSDWWMRDFQRTLILTLQGVFASLPTNVNDRSADVVTPSILIDTAAKLGDAADKLTAWGFHSYTYHQLLKQNLITFRKFSEQGEEMPMYLGKTVIVDDGIPITGGANPTVDSYLFGAGAFAFGEARPEQQPVEVDRDSLVGEDYLIMRKKNILHPRGVSFVGVPAAISPSDAELVAGANYSPVYEQKNIALARLVTKVV